MGALVLQCNNKGQRKHIKLITNDSRTTEILQNQKAQKHGELMNSHLCKKKNHNFNL